MLALLASVAVAADSPWADLVEPPPVRSERWQDGITQRAPIGAFGQASVAALGGTDLMLSTVRAGWGTEPRSSDAGFGFTVETAGFRNVGPGGADLFWNQVGGSGWATVSSDRSLHGVWVGYHRALTDTSMYRFHPTEAGERVVAGYVGVFDVDGLDFVLESHFGVAAVYGVELTAAGSMIWSPFEAVAFSAAVQGGFAPIGTALLGAHVRPIDHVELSLVGGFGYPIFRPIPSLDQQVALEIKVF